MNGRNYLIDWGRWMFAMFVVFIHVGIGFGYSPLRAFSFCAVPYFYLITGYYTNTHKMLTGGGWLHLWFRYLLIFLVINLVIWWWQNNALRPLTVDAFTGFLYNGSCKYVDTVFANGRVYGITTIWFLYGGAMSLYILHLLRRCLFTKLMLCIVIFIQITSILVDVLTDIRLMPLMQSLPYLYYGMLISRRRNSLRNILYNSKHNKVTNAIALIALYLLAFAEYKLHGHLGFDSATLLATIPLSLFIFSLIVTCPKAKKIKQAPKHIYTFDIYIWHRIVYYIVISIGIPMFGFDTVIIFLVTLALSYFCRNVISPLCVKREFN